MFPCLQVSSMAGQESLFRGSLSLSESPIKSEALCGPKRFEIFVPCDPAIDLRIVLSLLLGPVLIHDINIGMDRDFLRNVPENLLGRSDSLGHHQVPDEEASFCNSIGI